MKLLVTGGTGNVGSSVLRALADAEPEAELVALARRRPSPEALPPGVGFLAADLTRDELEPLLEGVDCVIHLAWAIQPARDRSKTRAINVEGSRRLFAAIARAGVGSLVYASSIGAYSAAQDRDRFVDESWPTGGIPSSFYSADKAAVESLLDGFEGRHPGVRVARLRPALVFKADAGSEIRRLFAGPLVPNRLLEPSRLPVLPWIRGLRAQAVHADDVADAYRRAALSDASGAFNIAAEPLLDADSLREGLGVRVLELPAAAVRAAADAAYRMRLQPTPPGWIDMATGVPLIDTARARAELGWEPAHRADATLRELLGGIADRAGEPTPPLASDTEAGGPLGRVAELLRGGPKR